MAMLKSSCPMPVELADVGYAGLDRSRHAYRIALTIPLQGSAGLWAPSCISSAQVAVAELNERNGIGGRRVQLIMIDAALECEEPVEEIINDLIEMRCIDAIVGMHISAVRQRLSKVVRQRVPYIYTPLYEGGERTLGLFAIGETPDEQLGPAMDQIQKTYRPKSWALIGNDYVWPRSSHSFAKRKLQAIGGTLAMERYIPFGRQQMDGLIEELAASHADAVLLSLVGQDAVTFNRAFGRVGLDKRMVRLSCAIEENALLACGARNLKRLFAVSSYFGALHTDANCAFKERYHSMHGDTAPTLNALGQSLYEGMHYLAGLMEDYAFTWQSKSNATRLAVRYKSGRRDTGRSLIQRPPIYLARADGVQFHIDKQI